MKQRCRPNRRLWPLFVGLTLISGCAHRIWFTQPLRESYELGVLPPHGALTADTDTKPARTPAELQYFSSQRIVLEREVTSQDDSLARGRIRVRRGRFIERIVVRRGTPGIATAWGDNWVAISFEEGTALRFDLGDPDQLGERGDVYNLRNTTDAEGRAEAGFGEHRYQVKVGSAAQLKVRRDAKTKRRWKRKVLRGRRVGD